MKKTYRIYLLLLLSVMLQAAGLAQSRNGYKINGITVAGGRGRGSDANQLNLSGVYNGICVDAQGNVYIADKGNNRIQKWAPGAREGETIFPGFDFQNPVGICLDDKDNLYVTSERAHCFYRYNLVTNKIDKFGADGGRSTDNLTSPAGIFVDQGGNIYVADNLRVFLWKQGAAHGITIAGGNGGGREANQISRPEQIYVDNAGALYVADWINHRIQKWAPGATEGQKVDGPAAYGGNSSDVYQPKGLFVDRQGNIFVSDASHDLVQMWSPGATLGLTVAGGGGSGTGTNKLFGPSGLWMDAAGNLYVADGENNRVIKFEKLHPDIVEPLPMPVQNNNTVVNPYAVDPVNPAPKPAPGQFTTLSWEKPVSDFGDLPDGAYHTAVAALPVKVKISSSSKIDPAKIRLLLNGVALAEGGKMRTVDLRTIAAGRQFIYEYATTIQLDKGNNQVQVRYLDDGTEPLKVSYSPQGLNLYVLSIGTNAAGLRYTKKDAMDFAGLFSSQQGDNKLFSQVSVQTLVGDEARAADMASRINAVGNKQYGTNDVLFVFISSHGYTKDDKLKITGSDYQTTIPDLTSIDFKEQVLDPLEAANCKKFIFLDACHSGAGIAGGKAATADVANEISKIIRTSNSTTIITSSSSNEQSWEDDQWGNGAFTRAIKEALAGKRADTNGDGIVSMDELFAYMTRRVPELVRAAGKTDYGGHPVTQTPKMYNPKGNVSIYVY